jgi:hypothetical protein
MSNFEKNTVKAVPNRVAKAKAKAKAKLDFFYNIAVLQPPSLTVL